MSVSADELAKRNAHKDCWVIAGDQVLDVTESLSDLAYHKVVHSDIGYIIYIIYEMYGNHIQINLLEINLVFLRFGDAVRMHVQILCRWRRIVSWKLESCKLMGGVC